MEISKRRPIAILLTIVLVLSGVSAAAMEAISCRVADAATSLGSGLVYEDVYGLVKPTGSNYAYALMWKASTSKPGQPSNGSFSVVRSDGKVMQTGVSANAQGDAWALQQGCVLVGSDRSLGICSPDGKTVVPRSYAQIIFDTSAKQFLCLKANSAVVDVYSLAGKKGTSFDTSVVNPSGSFGEGWNGGEYYFGGVVNGTWCLCKDYYIYNPDISAKPGGYKEGGNVVYAFRYNATQKKYVQQPLTAEPKFSSVYGDTEYVEEGSSYSVYKALKKLSTGAAVSLRQVASSTGYTTSIVAGKSKSPLTIAGQVVGIQNVVGSYTILMDNHPENFATKTFIMYKNGKYGIMSAKGKQLLPAVYDMAYNMANSNTSIVLLKQKGKWQFYDTAALTSQQTVSVATTSKKISASKVKKAKQTFSIGAKAKGKVTCAFAPGNTSKVKANFKISSSGKVTIKKGTKKGTYKLKLKLTAAKKGNYAKVVTTKTIVVKIK